MRLKFSSLSPLSVSHVRVLDSVMEEHLSRPPLLEDEYWAPVGHITRVWMVLLTIIYPEPPLSGSSGGLQLDCSLAEGSHHLRGALNVALVRYVLAWGHC